MKLDDILKGNYNKNNGKKEVVYYFSKVNWDNEPIEMIYCPQRSDAVFCPTCKKLFDITRCFVTEKRCIHCGQQFIFDVFYD